MSINIPLAYKIRKPKFQVIEQKLFVLIHGYGADENDLFGFETDLPDDAYVISLRAPHSLGFGGFYWYEINLQAGAKIYDKAQAIASLELINQSISAIKKSFQIQTKNTFVLGFSQGSILSYALAMRYPKNIKEIFLESSRCRAG